MILAVRVYINDVTAVFHLDWESGRNLQPQVFPFCFGEQPTTVGLNINISGLIPYSLPLFLTDLLLIFLQ